MRKVLAALSVSAVAAGFAVPAALAAPTDDHESAPAISQIQRAAIQKQREKRGTRPVSNERVRVVVMLKEQPSAPSESGEKSRLSNQAKLLESWKAKYDLKVDRQFGYLVNGFSAEMPEGKIQNLATEKQVASVRRERVYYQSEYSARELQGVAQAYKDFGVDGEGTVISIIDSGVYAKHPDMRLDDGVFKNAKIKSINPEAAGKFNEKVPTGYNYADDNFEVMDLTDSQHGQHVAGITAANGSEGDTPDFASTGRIDGAAPNAQLLAMKVFSNDPKKSASANDGDIIAAIEDSVKLKADVINMSLGSPNGVPDLSDGAYEAMKKAREEGVITLVAAGNEGQNFSLEGGPDDALGRLDDGTAGSPSTNDSAFSIASVNNSTLSVPLAYFEANGERTDIGYLEGVGEPDAKPHPYQYVGLGRPEDYKDGIDLKGKYALISRGEISFAEKFQYALDHGAEGVMVFNSDGEEGYRGMAGIDKFKTFGAALTNEQGHQLLDALKADPNATVTFTDQIKQDPAPDGLEPSSFTSWGTPNDLSFKPQLAGIGGNVYSTVGENEYENMSGTSMATPNVAGLSALLTQKFAERFPDITGKERVELIETSLMNTAKILENEDGTPYLPRQIGAGLAEVDRALATDVTATVDGEAAVALKQINGPKTFTVTLTNRGDQDRTFSIPAQKVLGETNEAGKPTLATVSNETLAASASNVTVPAGGTATVQFTLTPHTAAGNHFIEGWAQFKGENGALDIAVPYLGFVGDWNEENIIQEPGKPWMEDGPADNTNLVGSLGEATTKFNNPDEKPLALSPNGDGVLDTVTPGMLLMRNADEVEYEILDANSTVIASIGKDEMLRRMIGSKVPTAFDGDLTFMGRSFDGTLWDKSTGEQTPLADGSYTFRLKARIAEGYEPQITDLPFTVDAAAPTIEILDKEPGRVHFTAVDNQGGTRILDEPIVLDASGEQVTVEKQADGSFVATFDPATPYVTVGAVDRGFNEASTIVTFSDVPLFVNVNGHSIPEGESAYVGKDSDGALEVSGVVQGEVSRVTVNGEEAKITDGTFEYVDKAYKGPNPYTLEVIAYDASGKDVARRTITVEQDAQAPTITIDKSALNDDGKLVVGEDGSFTLSGTVTDERENANLKAWIFNEPVEVKPDGTFTYTGKVDPSVPVVTVVASDGATEGTLDVEIEGREAPAPEEKPEDNGFARPTYDIETCDAEENWCDISSKSEGVSEDGKTLHLTGKIQDPVSSIEFIPTSRAKDGTITRNEPIAATIEGDTFSVDLPIDVGIIDFHQIVKDDKGEEKFSGSFRLWVDIKPPSLHFTEPGLVGGTLYTNTDDVTFKGSISDDGWGHYLAINNEYLTDFMRHNHTGEEVNRQEFEHLVTVRDGDKLLVYSNDSMGNELVAVIPVVVDKGAPTVGVDTVKDMEVIRDQRELEAWGEDPNLANVAVSLNGKEIYNEDTELTSKAATIDGVLAPPEATDGDNAGAVAPNSVNAEEAASDAGDRSAPEPTTVVDGTETSTAQTRLGMRIKTADLPAGFYTASVKATDLAGNVTTHTTTFIVDDDAVIEGPDTVAFEVEHGALADQAAAAKQVLDHYTVTDDGSAFKDGDTTLALAPGTVLVPGEQKVTLVATDADGRSVVRVVTVTITEKQKAPEPSTPENPANPANPDDDAPERPANPDTDGGMNPGKPPVKGGSEGSQAPGKSDGSSAERPSRIPSQDASSHRGSHMPRTGAEIAATAGVAALIVLGGVVAVVVARRRGGK